MLHPPGDLPYLKVSISDSAQWCQTVDVIDCLNFHKRMSDLTATHRVDVVILLTPIHIKIVLMSESVILLLNILFVICGCEEFIGECPDLLAAAVRYIVFNCCFIECHCCFTSVIV